MIHTSLARLRSLSCVLLALGVAASPAFADDSDQKRRGLKRFLPAPFTKEREESRPHSPDTEAAIEDMRAFTSTLPVPGTAPEKPVTPEPAPSPRSPAPAKPASSAAAPPVAVNAEPTTTTKPVVESPQPEKKNRRSFFRLPFFGDPNPAEPQSAPPVVATPEPTAGAPADQALSKPEAEVAEAQPPAREESSGRRKLIKLPFGGGDDDTEKADVEVAGDQAPAEEEPVGRRKLIKLPFGSSDDRPELAAVSEVPSIEKKRSPLAFLPFVDNKEEAAPEPAPEMPPAGDDPVTEDGPPAIAEATATEPRSRFRLFGKNEAKPVEPEPTPELAAIEEPSELEPREKRSFLGIGRDKKQAAPEPVSTRDLGTGEKYVVTVSGTPFYSIGPSQPLPPDEILDKGRVVTMRKSGWGWSDIELAGGQMGVVATKNLRKASPAEAGGSWASRRSGGSTRGLFKVLDFNPAPEPELPTDAGSIPLGAGLLPPLDDD